MEERGTSGLSQDHVALAADLYLYSCARQLENQLHSLLYLVLAPASPPFYTTLMILRGRIVFRLQLG